ncbi:hypothetical protein V5O48_017270 [Marasmius crinis-equi]|uniref:Uncharacterized protein n=1 Tax=Marasmius crinis-equi TaxID=585013 RepID=A0ABR3EPG2_9AGAR
MDQIFATIPYTRFTNTIFRLPTIGSLSASARPTITPELSTEEAGPSLAPATVASTDNAPTEEADCSQPATPESTRKSERSDSEHLLLVPPPALPHPVVPPPPQASDASEDLSSDALSTASVQHDLAEYQPWSALHAPSSIDRAKQLARPKPKKIPFRTTHVRQRAQTEKLNPFDHPNKRKVPNKDLWTFWFTQASHGVIEDPPPHPANTTFKDHQLFVHIDIDRIDRTPTANQFITVWLWSSEMRVWERVVEGHCRWVDNQVYSLKLNNCFEPAWVKKKTYTLEDGRRRRATVGQRGSGFGFE